MKAAPPIAPKIAADPKSGRHNLVQSSAVIDLDLPSAPKANSQPFPAVSAKTLPDLTTFRALTKHVFGAEAGREHIKEAVVFAFMMAIAAWPLSITLNMLGTMMISPPPW